MGETTRVFGDGAGRRRLTRAVLLAALLAGAGTLAPAGAARADELALSLACEGRDAAVLYGDAVDADGLATSCRLADGTEARLRWGVVREEVPESCAGGPRRFLSLWIGGRKVVSRQPYAGCDGAYLLRSRIDAWGAVLCFADGFDPATGKVLDAAKVAATRTAGGSGPCVRRAAASARPDPVEYPARGKARPVGALVPGLSLEKGLCPLFRAQPDDLEFPDLPEGAEALESASSSDPESAASFDLFNEGRAVAVRHSMVPGEGSAFVAVDEAPAAGGRTSGGIVSYALGAPTERRLSTADSRYGSAAAYWRPFRWNGATWMVGIPAGPRPLAKGVDVAVVKPILSGELVTYCEYRRVGPNY